MPLQEDTEDERSSPDLPWRTASGELSLIRCGRLVYKYRWLILGLCFVAVVGATTWCLNQPRVYRASTSIVPPIDFTSGQGGGLASRLGGVGSSLLQGMLSEGNLSGLYVDILQSRAVADALIDRFDLMTTYEGVGTKTEAQILLRKNTRIHSTDEGIVHVTVTDGEPNRAAAMANAYVEELDRQNKRLSGGQATSKRIFLENRVREIKEELSRIEKLQSRDAEIKEMLFELLAQECEFAKMEEAKSMPTIQVLDAAALPERALNRGILQKARLAGLGGILIGILLAFGIEYVSVTVKSGSPKRGQEKGQEDTPRDAVDQEFERLDADRRRSVSSRRQRVREQEEQLSG